MSGDDLARAILGEFAVIVKKNQMHVKSNQNLKMPCQTKDSNKLEGHLKLGYPKHNRNKSGKLIS